MPHQFQYDNIARIITIPIAFGNAVTVQQLINDIRDYEDEFEAMDSYHIAEASGKESLGGGLQIGITLKLINWKLKFEARPPPDFVICTVTGGNLIAVDSTAGVETFADPVEPSAYVTVVITNAVSAAIASLEIANLQRLIETQRPHHTGTGNIWYWDPYGGADSNDGQSPSTPVATFAKAQSLAEESNHDIIICIPGDPSGMTTTTEPVVITKRYLFLRGPGRDFRIKPDNTAKDAVVVQAAGAEVSSMILGTAPGGGRSGLVVESNFTWAKDLWIEDADGPGAVIRESSNSIFQNVKVHGSGDDGLKVGNNVQEFHLICGHADGNMGHGLNLDGTNIEEVTIETHSQMYDNTGFGILVGAGAKNTSIAADSVVSGNILGDLQDNGVNTVYSHDILRDRIVDAIEDSTDVGAGLTAAQEAKLQKIPDKDSTEWADVQALPTLQDMEDSTTLGGLTPADRTKLHNIPDKDSTDWARVSILPTLIEIEASTVLAKQAELIRALGLMQENYFLDQCTYTQYQGVPLLASARLRIYSVAGSVGTDSDVIATYAITPVWSGNQLQSYKVVKQ